MTIISDIFQERKFGFGFQVMPRLKHLTFVSIDFREKKSLSLEIVRPTALGAENLKNLKIDIQE
jgi:hypothetical protein